MEEKSEKEIFHPWARLNYLIQKELYTKDLLWKYVNFHWNTLFHFKALLSAVKQFLQLYLISVIA